MAFKPNIDDLRESPALDITRKVCMIGFDQIFIVEPNIKKIPDGFNNENISLVCLEKALKSSDIIVLLVDHKEFKTINLELLSGKQLVDIRGSWSVTKLIVLLCKHYNNLIKVNLYYNFNY